MRDAKKLIREDAKKVNTNSMGVAKQEQKILSTEVRDQEQLSVSKDTLPDQKRNTADNNVHQEYTGI